MRRRRSKRTAVPLRTLGLRKKIAPREPTAAARIRSKGHASARDRLVLLLILPDEECRSGAAAFDGRNRLHHRRRVMKMATRKVTRARQPKSRKTMPSKHLVQPRPRRLLLRWRDGLARSRCHHLRYPSEDPASTERPRSRSTPDLLLSTAFTRALEPLKGHRSRAPRR